MKYNTSGGAFVIRDEDENILTTGFNTDTAHFWFSYSYRSEIQYCVAVIIFFHHLCEFYDINKPISIFYCDNKGLINKLNKGCIITKIPIPKIYYL